MDLVSVDLGLTTTQLTAILELVFDSLGKGTKSDFVPLCICANCFFATKLIIRGGMLLKDKYTLLILPPENGSARQLQISKKRFRLLLLGMVAVGLMLGSIVIGNIYLVSYIRNHAAEFAQITTLKEDLAAKEQQIQLLKAQNQEISQNLAELSKLEASIAATLKLPPPAPLSAASRGQSRNTAPFDPQTNLDLSQKHLALFQTYYAETQKLEEKRAHTPSIMPLQGEIVSTFGYRSNPFGGRSSEFHDGIDIACDYGSEVHATADGVITFAGWDGAYGRKVEIDHGYGIKTFYGHNSKLLVNTGDRVKKGQVIALSGNSGRSTGPHLHYGAIVNGESVDPSQLINETKE